MLVLDYGKYLRLSPQIEIQPRGGFYEKYCDKMSIIHTHQIVCLEYATRHLYAEVIEVVEWRQICWLRPLMLAVTPSENEDITSVLPQSLRLYDLRQGPDILWPTKFLRLVWDTEVIPLLAQLEDLHCHPKDNSDTRHQLADFIAEVWQTYPQEFESSMKSTL
ncbi:hypothetical protein MC7420_3090 [Coleofasciculus chthonoplastes PCC 7420]|uniref:Uncharacterized protein n=2 Tax=Coleofasciculaceae TaxID=1892251 RepID=B4VKK3_9CYAN|nr:hypothetical protein MC7420_3090 [Coleofasciculus chthonoplastes PCC 7420]